MRPFKCVVQLHHSSSHLNVDVDLSEIPPDPSCSRELHERPAVSKPLQRHVQVLMGSRGLG